MRIAKQGVLGGTLLLISVATHGQMPIAYPANGQSAQRQSADTTECQVWAKETTGVDPVALGMQMSQQPAPSATAPGAGLRGAAGGAAVGAIAGSIGGRAGEGAAAGAVVGMAAARANQRQRQQAQMQQQQTNQAQAAGQIATFNRAYSACMSGRGYTVR